MKTLSTTTFRRQWPPLVSLLCGIILIGLAYRPGLAGPFLFDDYGNLNVIGAFGPLRDWQTWLLYLTSGHADPTGRPIALLSFLLDAHDWPADPWPFKRTNLILHLLNTVLLALVVWRFQAALSQQKPNQATEPWTPVLTALAWGAHPYFVSTTLYVVQRQAMLPLSFTLLALLAWHWSVTQFLQGRTMAGWLWAILGFGSATLFAGLSKANGFLGPILTGAAYIWILRPIEPSLNRAKADRAAIILLALPSAIIIAYLIHTGIKLWWAPVVPGREWSLPERLLTQPRAIWSYFNGLLFPRALGGGLYVDGFQLSRSWLSPPTTLLSMAALLASLFGAIVIRKRQTTLSFAWIFFLSGHLLEGTTIPLEIYFEHRSYLPSVFLAWPVAHALTRRGAYLRHRTTLACAIIGGLLAITHIRAGIWGNEPLLTALDARQQPTSPRAQIYAANDEIGRGQIEQGLKRIHQTQGAHPLSSDVAINAIAIECAATNSLTPSTLLQAENTLARTHAWNHSLYTWLHKAIADTHLRQCIGFGAPGIKRLLKAMSLNPFASSRLAKRDILHTLGLLAISDGDAEKALDLFNSAIYVSPDPEYALVQAAALGEANAPNLGIQHLDNFLLTRPPQESEPPREMSDLHRQLLVKFGYFDEEIAHLRERLEANAKKKIAERSASQSRNFNQ